MRSLSFGDSRCFLSSVTGDAAATVLGEPFSISSSSEEDRIRFFLRPLFEADLTGDDCCSSSLETFSFSELGLKRLCLHIIYNNGRL